TTATVRWPFASWALRLSRRRRSSKNCCRNRFDHLLAFVERDGDIYVLLAHRAVGATTFFPRPRPCRRKGPRHPPSLRTPSPEKPHRQCSRLSIHEFEQPVCIGDEVGRHGDPVDDGIQILSCFDRISLAGDPAECHFNIAVDYLDTLSGRRHGRDGND